jgi:hypothetical protein
MQFEQIKNILLNDLLPTYYKQVGPCNNKEALKPPSLNILQEIAKLVFPEQRLVLQSLQVYNSQSTPLGQPQDVSENIKTLYAPGLVHRILRDTVKYEDANLIALCSIESKIQ